MAGNQLASEMRGAWHIVSVKGRAHYELRVCTLSPRVKQVLDISRLQDLIDVHEGLSC